MALKAITANEARPLVAGMVSNGPVWIFGIALGLGAIALFATLEARRAERQPTSTIGYEPTDSLISPPTALVLPPLVADEMGAPVVPRSPAIAVPVVPAARPAATPRVAPQRASAAAPMPPVVRGPAFYDPSSPDPPARPVIVPPMVRAEPPAAAEVTTRAPGQLSGNRAKASRLANPGSTVPQGAVIQAVLETALDSDRPGFARAIVSRDVRSFDGTTVLIPRGSRLFGEYRADLAQGQKRAFINWQKLTRPDGVQVAIESPAADPLGRAGVGGRVNTHFFERFSGAILQSALDIGVAVASRQATGDTVIVGLPGSTLPQTQINPQTQTIRPTLKVRHGTTVSVFVARDLDFTVLD